MIEPTYLGDGLYVEIVPGAVRLYTSDGIETTHQVFLDDLVLANFIRYLKNRGFMQ